MKNKSSANVHHNMAVESTVDENNNKMRDQER